MKYDISALTQDEKLNLLSGVQNMLLSTANGKLKEVAFCDGPHGVRLVGELVERAKFLNGGVMPPKPVATPNLSVLSCAWDEDLVRKNCEVIADDCISHNIDVILAPGVNIKRTPLCGRNFEYFSEDPFLAGKLARAYVEGMQNKGVGTSVKHFCANNREYDRLFISSEVDERTLREIYLPAFEEAVKAEPFTIMSSYNLINGVYAAEHKHLLDDILRKDFGFNGVILSDWDATREGWRSVKATLDVCMPENKNYLQSVKNALEEGVLSEEEIDARVIKILELIERTETEKHCTTTKEERIQIATEVARECFVLLKNEGGVLPLTADKILVAGSFNESPCIGGGGSAFVAPETPQQPLSAILERKLKYGARVSTVNWCLSSPKYQQKMTGVYKEAIDSDLVILCVGNDDTVEYECADRHDIKLKSYMEDMIINTAAYNENVIVLLYAGSAIDMSRWIDKVKAVLYVGFAGEGVNEALASVLLGECSPCGKLSETFPLKLEDCPVWQKPFNGFVDRYTEGVFVGYRHFDTFKKDVLFPFGHGLSYASFEYSDLKIIKRSETDYDVCYKITNTSDVTAKEISEVYVKDVISSVSRPEKELKGFSKELILPHQTVEVSVPLSFRSFAFYSDALKGWHVENGAFEILIGASSRDIRLKGKIEICLPKQSQFSNM